MTRRRFIQQPGGALVEVALDWRPDPVASVMVMPDIAPYRSMIDGSEIGSRSTHREHLTAHGCVEVGNDSSLTTGRPNPHRYSPPGLKEHILRAAHLHKVL